MGNSKNSQLAIPHKNNKTTIKVPRENKNSSSIFTPSDLGDEDICHTIPSGF